MTTTFDLRAWMTQNREMVIASHEKLTNEKFFNGISLRDFMVQVYNRMLENNPKSDKRALTLIGGILESVSHQNSKIGTPNSKDSKLSAKYAGTAFMALV